MNTLLTRSRQAIAVALIVALALALLPTTALAGTLDQSQTDTSTYNIIGGPGAYEQSQAQTFTAALSGALDQVDLFVHADNGASDITVEIHNVDNSGSPGPTVLATSTLSVPNRLPGAWYPVSFASPAQVTAGTQYAIVAYATGQYHVDYWYSSSGDVYPGGKHFTSADSPPSTWVSAAGDLAFKTYVRPPTADLSLTISGPSTARRASSATHILTVRNTGPHTAKNTVLTENLPFGARMMAITTTRGSCTRPSWNVRTVTCNLGDIASGGDSNSAVTIRIETLMPNVYLNFIARVTSDSDDPNPSNNTAVLSTRVSR